jgi:outer membrane protein assembly factor BamD
MFFRQFRLLVFLMIPLLVSSCAWFKTKEEKSAKELASEGMVAYRKGNYSESIEAFDKLKDWYPFSKYAILAELKVADAHYQLRHYEDAVFAYEQFESLHPRNEALPYVIYQIGRCYLDQIDTVDRDQSTAQKALEVFQRLKRQFPENPYAVKADEHIHRCYRSIAEHELYVGRYYMRAKYYRAAIKRFESVLTMYPDVGTHRKAIAYLASCQASLGGKDDLSAGKREPDQPVLNPESAP